MRLIPPRQTMMSRKQTQWLMSCGTRAGYQPLSRHPGPAPMMTMKPSQPTLPTELGSPHRSKWTPASCDAHIPRPSERKGSPGWRGGEIYNPKCAYIRTRSPFLKKKKFQGAGFNHGLANNLSCPTSSRQGSDSLSLSSPPHTGASVQWCPKPSWLMPRRTWVLVGRRCISL